MAYKIPSTKVKEKKEPKTREVFVVQGNYGQGWEDVTQETSWVGGKNRLKEYNDNEGMYGHRLISRRVPFFKLSIQEEEQNKKEKEDYFKRVLERRKAKNVL